MNSKSFPTVFVSIAAGLLFLGMVGAQAAPSRQATFLRSAAQQPDVLYTLKLPGGRSAVVYKSGIAKIYTADFSAVETRVINGLVGSTQSTPRTSTPTKAEIRFDLLKAPPHPYARGEVLVVYRAGVHGNAIHVPTPKVKSMRRSQGPSGPLPKYTSSAALNALLSRLGVDRSKRLFGGIGKGSLRNMSARVSAPKGQGLLNIDNAYELHVTGVSVKKAVAALKRSGQVAYASPEFYVTTMHTNPVPFSHQGAMSQEIASASAQLKPAMGKAAEKGHLPSNYGLQSSLQSAFNSPSLNAAAAYDEIARRFGQLPGEGEIITNVSLGDLTGARAAQDSNDPCHFYATVYGPTTIVQDGQRYLNLPSMPLIPTYTADASGNLNGLGSVCGVDPQIVEIGLDFSVMAPLPHDQQRPGEMGQGVTDLLGIAPGAQFRLVVPASDAPTNADIAAAFLAAAAQNPRPDVITASLGFGEDVYGFPSRYLGDSLLMRSVIASIVQSGIVVCISSGDGLRLYTNAAVGSSGGAAPTNLADGNPTDLNDVFLSTAPSRDPDTGAIAVGGTTLDDIFAAPPQDSANADLKAQHAFAETRWTGAQTFASGYGSRVNVSAPSDNIVSFEHAAGGAPDDVRVILEGGTSASAPEVAAAAAVVMQVARLAGRPFPGPQAVRKFLEQSGTTVPKVPQSDVDNHVGPQVNLGHAVEKLLSQAGNPIMPQVTSVAIEQRRGYETFQSNTDPTAINLTGSNANAWITLAPNWEGIRKPDKAHYRLTVSPQGGKKHNGKPRVIATTPWARVLPKTILKAAGLPVASDQSRTVNLTYRATGGGSAKTETTFSLTFGPTNYNKIEVLAPTTSAVAHGSTVTVHYDLRDTGATGATLEVSEPGRLTPFTYGLYRSVYSVPISGKGTVEVPVSALEGGGIYGIGIHYNPYHYSSYDFVRVQPQASDTRPPAPLLSANGSNPGHLLEIPYGSDFTVSWNVANVPGATGAILEISDPGPNSVGSYRTFNNPNGSERDDNGIDTGSIYYVRLPGGTSGSTAMNGKDIAAVVAATMYENVRVLPVSGGTVVGEASDVSSITMDGVAPSGGGSLVGILGVGSWGINSHGMDGFLTTVQTTASGQDSTSLQIFSEESNAITQVVDSEVNHLFYTLGWGIYGNNDVAVFGDYHEDTGTLSYHTLDLAAGGTIALWTPPSDIAPYITLSAANQVTGTGLFLVGAWSPMSGLVPEPYVGEVFTSDLATNGFGPIYDIHDEIDALGYQLFNWQEVGENPNTHVGIIAGANPNNFFFGPPELITFNLDNGKIKHVIEGVGVGTPMDIAVDVWSGKAIVPTGGSSTVGIYDVSTGNITPVALGYGFGNNLYAAADSTHHLFLVLGTLPPDFESNCNANGVVYVLDEQGNVLKSLEHFNLNGVFLPAGPHELQVNPSERLGYTYGLGGQQLAPFHY
ncbi:MAG TPA: S8 family serine peptidase [Gammaproteobacteria bacterium]|nr:S8 family serine peptidase [Gammaproteobacteria bacterium]